MSKMSNDKHVFMDDNKVNEQNLTLYWCQKFFECLTFLACTKTRSACQKGTCPGSRVKVHAKKKVLT